MDNNIREIVSNVGVPALLEQTAEECSELAKVCLKLARKIRNENPTPTPLNEILANLNEEVADIINCIDIVSAMQLVDDNLIGLEIDNKMARWINRLNASHTITAYDAFEKDQTKQLLEKIYILLNEKGE